MKSFSSKERKELLKRWNERNNKNANTTTNAKTNAKTLLNSSNSDGSMSLKEEGKGTPRDDEEENEKQIGNSKTFESRSSRSAGKTSTSKDEYDRDFRSKNADVRNNGSISSSSSGVLRQRQEEAQQNVLMKRKKLSRDAENQRGTKDFAPDDEDWRMQSRNVWLSSYYNTNKSNVVVAPTADDNTNEGGDVLDPNDFDDAFITRRGVEDGFVSKGQRKEESGREENIPNNNTIAAEERKRTNTAATTSSKSKTSSRGGKEDKYLLYTQAMERLATKMKTENDEQMNQSKRLEEAQTKEHLMLKKSLEKEQMLNRKLEKDCESLKEKKLTAARERDRFSERVSRAEAEKERVLREIAKTKSKSTHLLKEHKFTIEAQGAMLEQLRRELETSEKMALDAERKCDAMTRERSETEERLANAREKLKSMEEKSTDLKQNSRAIKIAQEKVLSLTSELKEKKEINAKMEETNAKLQKEVNARKREFAEIQKQLESDVETERSLRVHAEKNMEKMMEEMQSIEEEKRKRIEELRVLEESLRSIEEERDALKKMVSQRELEIFKHLQVIAEKDKIENEWIGNYSTLQEEIEVRDLKAIESYNQVDNNSNNEVQRKAAEIDRKEQFFSSKASSNNNHSKMLAVERQKVTDAMKAKRYLERQLQDEKRKLQEKEKMLNALEEKYAATAKRVNSDDTKAEEALKILNEKVAKMTAEMHEKDERLKANEELLHRMHSEKKKRDDELERMRVSLTQKEQVVKKLEDDLKSSEVQKANNNNNSVNQQQHVFMMKEKDATIQSAQSKVAALEAKAKQSSANEENLRKELEQLQKSERTAKAEREHLERQLRMAEEKEKKLSAQVDAMSVDRQKSSSNAAELFEANRLCYDLRAKCEAKDKQLEEMRLELKKATESYENEHKKHLQTQEDCAIYFEDLQEAAEFAEKTICEHQRTIETNKEEMERLQTNLANAEKKCELAWSEAQSFKTSLENTQTVLSARVEEIEHFRSQSTSEKENMSSKLMFLEDESASLHTKMQEKQTKLNKALGDISKYQQESEQAKRQLEAFRASKEVTEERLREEQDKLKKSEQNCEQLSDMLKKNVERHANVLSANERMKNMEIEDLKDALRSLERKALKIAEVVHIDKAFFDGLDVEAQVIVEDFCATSKNVSSPTPSKMNINNGGGKTPMTAPSANRGNFVSAPSSPADRFQTPQTSMQTSSRLGRTTIATTTTSKSAGKPVLTFSSAGKHQHKSHVSQRIWGMVSEASKINVDLQGLAESAKKRLQEHQEQLSEKKKINNSAVKALRLDVVNGEDSGQKPKPKAGTPSKRRVLQPVPFNAQ
jgi:predicted  nucleic acid-binding Zn-ribbon protein